MRSAIKVLIVDDSALIRQMLTRALSLDPRIEIVGIAKNGVEAIEQARDLQPDVITLDIEMPQLSGIEALPHIKKSSRARVLMLSTVDDPGTTYQALSLGAIDFIAKPKGGFASSISDLSELLLKKIRTAYRVDPISALSVLDASGDEERREGDHEGAASEGEEPPTAASVRPRSSDLRNVVAIAASTGGPPALERVFRGLRAGHPATYLVVQHLPAGFSASLAKRLDAVTDIAVVEAEQDMPLTPDAAYLAPYGSHMTIEEAGGKGYIRLESGAPIHGVQPAADPLFSSVAQMYGSDSVGVVLTGMGSDGADGLREIKAAGGETIAQNEETSVVWGMPGAALKAGAAKHVVPIGLVAAEIRRSLRRGE